MAKQSINLGSSANDGTGTTIRAGGDIVNDNFDELYTAIGTGSNLQITVSGASNGQALIYSSSNSRFEPANQSGGLSDIVGDTSPQLGGDLDVNGNAIISASNGNIEITPNGSGEIQLDGLKWPTGDGSGGQFLQTNGSSQLAFATVLQNVSEDTSPQLGANLDVQTNEITTSTSNGNIKLNANGTGVVEVKGDGSSADGTVQLNCSQNSHGIKLASPPHSAAQSYTLTFPQTAPAANKLLQTDGSGNLSFSSDLTIDSLTMSGSGNVTFTAATTLALNANTGGTVVVNDGSNNADFRVESDGNANMIFVDAGSDHVNIGTNSDLGGVLNVSGTGVFETADNTDTLSLVSTDADASSGPNLRMYRNSASPADSDLLGVLEYEGRNDNSEDIRYVQITSFADDVSDGEEDGSYFISTMLGGTLRNRINVRPTETVFNEESQNLDFRVESDNNTHMIFVDAGADHVNIGGAGDSEHTLNVSGNGFFTTADNTDTLTLECTDTDANNGPVLCLHRNSASPADADLIGRIDFSGESDLGSEQNYAVIKTFADDVSHGVENGQFSIFTRVGGSEIERVSMGAAATVFNDSGANLDFRVESDNNANMFTVDAGNDQVSIGSNSDLSASLGVTAAGERAMFVAQTNNSDVTAAIWKNVYANGSNSATMIAFQNSDNTEVGSIKSTGSATAFNTSSDYRLKENVDYTWDATTRLKQLKPARFNWISDDTNTLLDGFLAHEVSSIVPEAISGTKDAVDDDGNPKYQGIDQSKLVPLLVKTIQELEARITTLEG